MCSTNASHSSSVNAAGPAASAGAVTGVASSSPGSAVPVPEPPPPCGGGGEHATTRRVSAKNRITPELAHQPTARALSRGNGAGLTSVRVSSPAVGAFGVSTLVTSSAGGAGAGAGAAGFGRAAGAGPTLVV